MKKEFKIQAGYDSFVKANAADVSSTAERLYLLTERVGVVETGHYSRAGENIGTLRLLLDQGDEVCVKIKLDVHPEDGVISLEGVYAKKEGTFVPTSLNAVFAETRIPSNTIKWTAEDNGSSLDSNFVGLAEEVADAAWRSQEYTYNILLPEMLDKIEDAVELKSQPKGE